MAAYGRILTLDNLMLRGRSSANRCCCVVVIGNWWTTCYIVLLHIHYGFICFRSSACFGSCQTQWQVYFCAGINSLGIILQMFGIWSRVFLCGFYGWNGTAALLRTLKRHWKSYLCSASVVFLIGLVARVLLIVPLYLSLCFHLESFPDFLLVVIGFFLFFVFFIIMSNLYFSYFFH